jgi:hypothetical protein
VTAGLDEPQADRSASGSAAFDSAAIRTLLAVLALAAGLAVAWLVGGRVIILGVLAVLLAAGNGYAKAYSP